MASPWMVVARREFLERVRSKWFIIVTLLGPIGMIGVLVVPAYLAVKSAEKGVHIQVVDKSDASVGALMAAAAEPKKAKFRVDSVPPDTPTQTLLDRIRDEEIDGYLLLEENVVESGHGNYYGDNATNMGLERGIERLLKAAVMTVRAKQNGIDTETLKRLMVEVKVNTEHTTGSAETSEGKATFIVGYIAMFILYMAILLYATNVLRSVVLEKTSRVVEVVVSATEPRSLMFGKIIGVGGVGLFQLSIWAAIAMAMVQFSGAILSMFGLPDGLSINMPHIAVLDLVVVLLYFVLGFVFYAAIYAAIGAMVNSDQEAQQVQMPVVILLIIPVMCVTIIANDPRGGAAQALTMIPISSPVLMPMRYLLDGATLLELLASLAILTASIAVAVSIAARIYRVGILMYGKRPTMRELIRWIRYT